MNDDPKPSWLTRLVALLLSWLKGRDTQAAADTAATRRDQDAAHAVQQVEAGPPASDNAVSDRLRDGSF